MTVCLCLCFVARPAFQPIRATVRTKFWKLAPVVPAASEETQLQQRLKFGFPILVLRGTL